jgi:hypothetical protein
LRSVVPQRPEPVQGEKPHYFSSPRAPRPGARPVQPPFPPPASAYGPVRAEGAGRPSGGGGGWKAGTKRSDRAFDIKRVGRAIELYAAQVPENVGFWPVSLVANYTGVDGEAIMGFQDERNGEGGLRFEILVGPNSECTANEHWSLHTCPWIRCRKGREELGVDEAEELCQALRSFDPGPLEARAVEKTVQASKQQVPPAAAGKLPASSKKLGAKPKRKAFVPPAPSDRDSPSPDLSDLTVQVVRACKAAAGLAPAESKAASRVPAPQPPAAAVAGGAVAAAPPVQASSVDCGPAAGAPPLQVPAGQTFEQRVQAASTTSELAELAVLEWGPDWDAAACAAYSAEQLEPKAPEVPESTSEAEAAITAPEAVAATKEEVKEEQQLESARETARSSDSGAHVGPIFPAGWGPLDDVSAHKE